MTAQRSTSQWRGRGRGQRVDVATFDEQLQEWYVDEGLSIRETYHRLKRELLDADEWTTELAVRYRLVELGHFEPSGHFDELEARLLELDPADVPPASMRRRHGASPEIAPDGGRSAPHDPGGGGDRREP